MAASDVALNIILKAQDQTSGAFNSATTGLSKMEKATSAARVAMGALTGVAMTSLVGALSDVARAAAEDEANVVKLQTAVENSGVAWEDNVDTINARIKAGQNLAFTDTQTRDSLGALTQTTGSLEKALKLQTLAMDLSRAKGMDLTTASELVGKVAQGNTSILKRYGVVLDENATAQDALAALQKKFGGQAEAYGSTTSAAIFKVTDSIEEWRESIGAALGPAQGLIALLPGLTGGMQLAGAAFGGATPLIHLNVAALKTLGATLATGGIVLGAIALVGIALWQVAETVKLVTDNWEKFKFALTSGRLNDIPVFGFFFQKVQQALSFIQGVINAWNRLQELLGVRHAVQAGGETIVARRMGGEQGFAEGTPYVPFDMLAAIHKGERIIPADQNRAGAWGGVTVNVYADVIDAQAVDRLADRIGGHFTMQRRIAGLA